MSAPFNYSVERDPVLAKKLRQIRGKPKAFMDTPLPDDKMDALRIVDFTRLSQVFDVYCGGLDKIETLTVTKIVFRGEDYEKPE